MERKLNEIYLPIYKTQIIVKGLLLSGPEKNIPPTPSPNFIVMGIKFWMKWNIVAIKNMKNMAPNDYWHIVCLYIIKFKLINTVLWISLKVFQLLTQYLSIDLITSICPHFPRVESSVGSLQVSCWVTHLSFGSHLATGRPLIYSTVVGM